MENQKNQGYSLTSFNSMITASNTQEYLLRVLGERRASFVNNLTALVASNDKLQECKPVTLMYAALKATALNLPLDQNLGYAYVIPYKTKVKDDNGKEIEIMVAQFQIGYKGFKQLALRTGLIQILNATDIRDGEIKDRNRLTGEITFEFIQDEKKRNESKIIGYVSYFELQNGFKSMLYMSIEEMQQHGLRYSQTFKSSTKWVKESSKWTTDFDAMALKTVTKLNLSRNAPLSVEMQTAIKFDQSVMEDENTPKYIDNTQEIPVAKPVLELETIEFQECVKALLNGAASLQQIRDKFDMSDDVEAELCNQAME